MPKTPGFRQGIADVSAPDIPENAFRWIIKVDRPVNTEDGGTRIREFSDLEDSEDLQTLDARLAVALTRVPHGDIESPDRSGKAHST